MEEEKLSYISLAIPVKRLQNTGLFRLGKDTTKLQKIIHSFFSVGVISCFLVYELQQIMKVFEVINDADKVINTMFLLLTNTDCIYKFLVFSIKPSQIERILNVLKGPIFNQNEPDHLPIHKATIGFAIPITRWFTNLTLLTCFLWFLQSTILHLQGKYIEFSVWLPFDPNNDPFYYIAAISVLLQTSLLGYCNSTLDIFATFLLEQCRTQLTILRSDLMNVVERSKIEATETSSDFDKILERRFKKMIIHHHEITTTADAVQDIFGGAIFFQFLVSAWILCCTAHKIVRVDPASIEFFSMITYVMCILIEVYLYCHYGTKLTYESEKLMETAYCMDWLEMPVKQRKVLLIFMERIKIPIEPMAASIIPLSNSTYTSIIRSSFSFYAFLKNSS